MNKKIFTIFFLTTLVLSVSVFAGTFTPNPASPGASSYTLSDIYNKINSNSYSYSPHTYDPSTTPGSTGITLTELWNIIPPFKSLSAGSLDTGILDHGIYPASDLTTAEPNLIASSIATGTTIFGVMGTCVATPPPDPCLGTPAIGTICDGGALYAGTSVVNGTTYKYMTTPNDAGLMQWNNVNGIRTFATSTDDGLYNTNHLLSLGLSYTAAYYCKNTENTGGYSDWFLPSKDELNNVLFVNRIALGGFDLSEQPRYWSSSEFSGYGATWYQMFNNGDQLNINTVINSWNVRCVRKY